MPNDIGQNLRAFLLASAPIAAAVGSNVCQDHVPEGAVPPFIWFSLRGTLERELINPAVGQLPLAYQFDVECVAETLDAAQALAALVRALNNTARATFGDSTVQTVFVYDQNDEYLFKNDLSDSGFGVCAVSLEITP